MPSRNIRFTTYSALRWILQYTATSALTPSPTTPSPTKKPVGTQFATYDENFGAPYCENTGSACDSRLALNGVDGYESFAPNTIDGCRDYSIGTYRVDESIEKIIIRTVSREALAMGTEVEVAAVVYTATNTTGRDKAKAVEWDVGSFFYTPDARNVSWQYLDTLFLQPGSGAKTLTTRFTLARGSSTQAVRLTYGYMEFAIEPCERDQYWQDIDDLVFTVGYGDFPPPSSQPSASARPSKFPSVAPTESTSEQTSIKPTSNSNSLHLTAVYNASLKAPYCSNIGSSCSSGILLDGSGLLAEIGHRERNAPNTIDDCKADQETASSFAIQRIYRHDETIDKIVIRSVDEGLLRIGCEAELEVTVWSAQDTTKRNNPNKWSVAHLYYAPKVESSNVTWIYILSEAVAPSQGKYNFNTRLNLESDLSWDNSSSATVTQAVRVSYSYDQYKPNHCPENADYRDVDDLVFDAMLVQPVTAPSEDLGLPSRTGRQHKTSRRASVVIFMLSLLEVMLM
eukprot:CCRYP_017648-RA/>CCRYP_017648-RA protein AED:0.36 eAED:0.36 QI:96/1/1/1/0.5/0.33/3/154/511